MNIILAQAKDASAIHDVMLQAFNYFQRVSKHPLKVVKASSGCHGIGKECLGDVSLKPSHPCDNG